MSNTNDETLLEEEDGEDEYDLGNEEEEALLADDCDNEQELHHGSVGYMKKGGGRKNISYSNESKIYRESEEPLEDDVLDLDDFESDILETTDYGDEVEYTEAQDDLDAEGQHETGMQYHEEDIEKSMGSAMDDANNNEIPDTDMRNQEGASGIEVEEHLQPSTLEEDSHGDGRKESEDEEEDDDKRGSEGRGRFKSERTTMISLKGNKSFGNIPDTLDGLITMDDKQEGPGRWKRSGGGRGGAGFSRGGFRGNQRGFGSNFGPRRKQQVQNRQGNHQNMGFPHSRVEGPSESMNSLLGHPPPFMPSSHKIHINPHFRGNVQPQPEAPLWNENPIGNLPPANSGGQPPQFHDAPRFPPPSMGYGNVDHGDPQPNIMDHHRQQRQRSPPPQNPFHSGSGGRAGGYDTSPGHLDYHREPYEPSSFAPQSHGPPLPEAWMNPPQRIQESSIGPPGGHHHQFGGSHQHFPSIVHNERGSGEVLQHFRPTMQPGPLFSHVTSVAPPSIPQQNLIMQQQHLQNLLRAAPPLHNAGLGQMIQLPPQETHNRIPPPGFSPNDGRPVPSIHHGPSPWQEQPVNRSPMGGQHMSIVQQQQQHSGFHQGGPRSFPVERGGNLQGLPLHHLPHTAASMSAPPPPFHTGNVPQGPPPHPLHQQHPHQGQLRQNSFNSPSMGSGGNSGPSGNHDNGRFPRQGSGNFQSPGFNRNPPTQQGLRPNRGAGHMAQGRGGLGPRRGILPNIRPLQTQKSIDDGFPPKRSSMDGPNPSLKPSPPKKRKMRKIMKSNLHEVETVDTLPDTTTVGDKETHGGKVSAGSDAKSNQPEDAALLEYQKKIDQQKRLREKVLQQKEQRRKLMALQKQKELQEKAALSGELSNDVPKGNAIATIVNRNPVEPSPSTTCVPVKKEPVLIPPFIPPTIQNSENQLTQPRLTAAQKKALLALKNARGPVTVPMQQIGRGIAMRGVGPRGMMNQPIRPQNPGGMGNPPGGGVIQQGGQRYKIVQLKNDQGQVIRKKVPIRPGMAGRGNVVGRGQVMEGGPQQIRPMGQGRGNMMGNKAQQVQAAAGSHRLVQVLPAQQQGHPQNQESNMMPPNMLLQRVVKQTVLGGIQQQQQGRKVVVQNMGGGGDSASVEGGGPGTVVVENLAASTSEADLRKMCQSVGRVLSVQMVPSLRSALVEFAHPSSAATFFQRYQRKIVDLSMISVRLANS